MALPLNLPNDLDEFLQAEHRFLAAWFHDAHQFIAVLAVEHEFRAAISFEGRSHLGTKSSAVSVIGYPTVPPSRQRFPGMCGCVPSRRT